MVRLSRRSSLLSALFALSVSPQVCWGQQTDVKVTCESKATALPLVLKQLSKSSGIKLECMAGFDNTPLILSVHDKPLKEVMDKIAEVVVGKWTPVDTGFRFESDKEAWKKLQAAAYESRKAKFAQAIQKRLEARAKLEAWNESVVKDLIEKEVKSRQDLIDNLRKNNPNLDTSQVKISKGSSRQVTPASPALSEILRKLPVDKLANLAPGQRLVMSSSPTPTQTPLPFNAGPIISKFVDAHNLLASMVRNAPATPDNIQVQGGLDLGAKPLVGQLAKLLVVLTRHSSDSGASVEVKFVDQNGNYVGTAAASIQPEPDDVLATDPVKVDNTDPVAISDLSKEIANAFVNSSNGGDGGRNILVVNNGGGAFRVSSNGPQPTIPMSQAAYNMLIDPVTYDPVSTFISEGLMSSASNARRDLVALVPDSVIPRLSRTSIKNVPATEYLKDLSQGGCKVQDTDGWLVVTPKDRFRMQSTQMNRSAAKKLYSAVASKGYARLYQLAQFAQSLGSVPLLNNFGVTTLKVIDPYVAETLSDDLQTQPTVLQFLGTLDASVFEALKPEYMVRMAGLNNAQKALMDKLVYGADRMGGIIGEGDFVGISIDDGPNGNAPTQTPDLAQEPTESMPNGLPLDGQVMLEFKPAELVRAAVKASRGGEFVTAEQLGSHIALQSTLADPSFAGKLPTFDSFIAAQGYAVTVKPQFTRQSNGSYDFNDAWTVPGALPVPFSSLDAGFRDAVEKSREKMSSTKFSFGNGEKPPARS